MQASRRGITFLLLLLVWIVQAATATTYTCVSPSVCDQVDPVYNCSAHSALVACRNVSSCIRSLDYWSTHLDEWPNNTSVNYCLHTWSEILMQDVLPDICQSLARILITLRLNEFMGNVNSTGLITIMDSAELETISCCSNPATADALKIHSLYNTLVGGYNNFKNQFCPLDLAPDPGFQWTLHDYVSLTALGLALLLIIGASIHVCLHYAILCRTQVTDADRVQNLFMILREKFSYYYIVPDDDENNEEDEENRDLY